MKRGDVGVIEGVEGVGRCGFGCVEGTAAEFLAEEIWVVRWRDERHVAFVAGCTAGTTAGLRVFVFCLPVVEGWCHFWWLDCVFEHCPDTL